MRIQVGKNLEKIYHQRRFRGGKYVYEKMLSNVSHQGKAN